MFLFVCSIDLKRVFFFLLLLIDIDLLTLFETNSRRNTGGMTFRLEFFPLGHLFLGHLESSLF